MPTRTFSKRLTWRGLSSIAEVTRKLEQRKPVVVSLPWSFHHALSVRLCDRAKLHGALDVSGGSELLARLADTAGLHDFNQLREPLRLAGARVRVHSPPPQVHLFFPESTMHRPWCARSRHQPSSISTHVTGLPSSTYVGV
jgi:hypothetical protein